MNHEFRTPLTVIIGYSDVIATELEDRVQPDLVPDLMRIKSSRCAAARYGKQRHRCSTPRCRCHAIGYSAGRCYGSAPAASGLDATVCRTAKEYDRPYDPGRQLHILYRCCQTPANCAALAPQCMQVHQRRAYHHHAVPSTLDNAIGQGRIADYDPR
ncbi:hypothetical protein HC891_07895 [Candidatus Gracilibacteria bacterium]|nr:hypothetical protein [Candidatus Gracilibacteria bacterium]